MSAEQHLAHTRIDPPDPSDDIDYWTVHGDLRAPGSGWSDDANYDCQDALRARHPDVDFDPESACFFAYAKTEGAARALAEAVDTWVAERRGAR